MQKMLKPTKWMLGIIFNSLVLPNSKNSGNIIYLNDEGEIILAQKFHKSLVNYDYQGLIVLKDSILRNNPSSSFIKEALKNINNQAAIIYNMFVSEIRKEKSKESEIEILNQFHAVNILRQMMANHIKIFRKHKAKHNLETVAINNLKHTQTLIGNRIHQLLLETNFGNKEVPNFENFTPLEWKRKIEQQALSKSDPNSYVVSLLLKIQREDENQIIQIIQIKHIDNYKVFFRTYRLKNYVIQLEVLQKTIERFIEHLDQDYHNTLIGRHP